jgi:ABC-type multidrug transport system fused ATPase/permease subunit
LLCGVRASAPKFTDVLTRFHCCSVMMLAVPHHLTLPAPVLCVTRSLVGCLVTLFFMAQLSWKLMLLCMTLAPLLSLISQVTCSCPAPSSHPSHTRITAWQAYPAAHALPALTARHCLLLFPCPPGAQIYARYQQYLSKTIQTSVANSTKVAEEVVSSMATVRSFANEPSETKRCVRGVAFFAALCKERLEFLRDPYPAACWEKG